MTMSRDSQHLGGQDLGIKQGPCNPVTVSSTKEAAVPDIDGSVSQSLKPAFERLPREIIELYVIQGCFFTRPVGHGR
jgi:hypothetical protein